MIAKNKKNLFSIALLLFVICECGLASELSESADHTLMERYEGRKHTPPPPKTKLFEQTQILRKHKVDSIKVNPHEFKPIDRPLPSLGPPPEFAPPDQNEVSWPAPLRERKNSEGTELPNFKKSISNERLIKESEQPAREMPQPLKTKQKSKPSEIEQRASPIQLDGGDSIELPLAPDAPKRRNDLGGVETDYQRGAAQKIAKLGERRNKKYRILTQRVIKQSPLGLRLKSARDWSWFSEARAGWGSSQSTAFRAVSSLNYSGLSLGLVAESGQWLDTRSNTGKLLRSLGLYLSGDFGLWAESFYFIPYLKLMRSQGRWAQRDSFNEVIQFERLDTNVEPGLKAAWIWGGRFFTGIEIEAGYSTSDFLYGSRAAVTLQLSPNVGIFIDSNLDQKYYGGISLSLAH